MPKSDPRSGTEPNTARSALGMRRGLAYFGLITCSFLAGWLAKLAIDETGGYRIGFWILAVLAAAAAVGAIIDLLVIQRRMRQ